MKTGTPSAGSPAGDWSAMLRARMIHNAAAGMEPGPRDGERSLAVPTRRPGWLVPPLSWVVRPPATRRVVLDALGAEVWDLCDGKRTVENVIDAFAAGNGLTFHEARVSVTAYLKALVQQGALAVARP